MNSIASNDSGFDFNFNSSKVRDNNMSSRVRSNRRQVLKTDRDNGVIFHGRSDYVLFGNCIIALQQSKNGSVSECRFNMADSTLQSLANDISKYLATKHKVKRPNLQQRLKSYGWTN